MSLVGFDGRAGTGKTTQLRAVARKRLHDNPIGADQRVLALTKMHGSRKRMKTTLAGPDGLGVKADCLTIDSFAWRLVRRWRSLLRQRGTAIPREEAWAAVTTVAGALLGDARVACWVALRYPVVVVDEMQDCRGGELVILQGLAGATSVFCAADGFQDLFGGEGNEAVEWAEDAGDMTTLSEVHRTDVAALLHAASALRDGRDLPTGERWSPYCLLSTPAYALGASTVAWMLRRSWSISGTTVALLSAARPERSPFVRRLCARLEGKPFKAKKGNMCAGPYRFHWEDREDDEAARILGQIDLLFDGWESLSTADLASPLTANSVGDLREWANRRLRLVGQETLDREAMSQVVTRLVRRRRAFGTPRQRRLTAMTIHQAKNREFDFVVVVWPMQIRGDALHLRRLLYNAITRAKQGALVLVEDPKRDRLSLSPFKFTT